MAETLFEKRLRREAAQTKLAAIVEANRASPTLKDWVRRRAAALRGRKPTLHLTPDMQVKP